MGREGKGEVGTEEGRDGKEEGKRSIPANKNLRLHSWSSPQKLLNIFVTAYQISIKF